MADQEQGVAGRMVGAIVRRSVRHRFRGVYWRPPAEPLEAPVIFACNHHGWFDGHVMFHVVERLRLPSLLWIEELEAFPLFSKAGAMPFPVGDAARRAATIRRTIRLMSSENRSLVIFPEGVLHRAPDLLPFGRALEFVAAKVERATVLPVAIRYEMGPHERPEAFVSFGSPVSRGKDLSERAHVALVQTLADLGAAIGQSDDTFQRLAEGTKDVNERWDMRRIPGRRGRSG